jgi:hypothetical protein
MVSAVLIFFLVKSAGFVKVKQVIVQSNLWILLICLILYLIGQAICSYKWKILAEALGFTNRTKEYFQYYFTGMFFNLFLPTTVGGDVIKSWYLSKNSSSNNNLTAFYSVLADRITGVAVIVLIATVAMSVSIGNNIPLSWKIPVFCVLFCIMALPFIFRAIIISKFRTNQKFLVILTVIKTYLNNKTVIAKALWWALMFHLTVIGIHILIGKNLGINISPYYYLILYPVSAIAGFIPVSFNGIGPREASYLIYFGFAGIESAPAVAFGIEWFAIVFIASLFGLPFYIKGFKKNTVPA